MIPIPISRAHKRGQFCPECNVVFGRESELNFKKEYKQYQGRPPVRKAPQGDNEDNLDPDIEYAYCWVCSRQHHLSCVGQATFICSACQRKTLERTISGPGRSGMATRGGDDSNMGTPMTTRGRPRKETYPNYTSFSNLSNFN